MKKTHIESANNAERMVKGGDTFTSALALYLSERGLVMVPREPTMDMIDAAWDMDEYWQRNIDQEGVYKAMLAAAPSAFYD